MNLNNFFSSFQKLIRMEKKLSWQRNERVYNKQKWNELDEFVNFNLIYCFTCFRIFDIWKVKCVSVHICYTYLHVLPDCCVNIHHFINYIRFYQQKNLKVVSKFIGKCWNVERCLLLLSWIFVLVMPVILTCYLCLFAAYNFNMYLVYQWYGMIE